MTSQTSFLPNTKAPFEQQFFHSFFMSHPYPFSLEIPEGMEPIAKSTKPAMSVISNAFDLQQQYPLPSPRHLSLSQLKHTHMSVIEDVLGPNGTSRRNTGEIWIPDIPRITFLGDDRLRTLHTPRLLECQYISCFPSFSQNCWKGQISYSGTNIHHKEKIH